MCSCLFNIACGLQTLQEFTDLVPLLVPAKVGGSQAIRVVLTSSNEDKNVFEVSRKSQLSLQENLSVA